MIGDIIKAAKMHPSRVFNVYLFGSTVYSTNDKDSDIDVVIVGNNSVPSIEIKSGIYNIHIFTPDKFKEDLNWHTPKMLECIYAPPSAILKETIKFDFKLDLNKLRHATSHVSSNSWVKCKKKLLLTDEYNIGIKSLFHSLRIPMFSIQIIENGFIKDFKCANYIWDKLKSRKWTWDELDSEFRGDKNKILTQFRILASKD